jgi:cytochrome c oxidase subunit 3
MTITLGFLAILMATVVWWLIRQSVNVQPWVAGHTAQNVHGAVLDRPAAKTALWVFMAVATSLFALFVSAYAMRIGYLDWRPMPQPRLLTLNTAFLVLASIAMQWSVSAARRGQTAQVRIGMMASGVFTIAFIVGQLWVWKQLGDAGYFVNSNAATSFFYLLTAVHGLHVVGGLVAWCRATARAWLDGPADRLRLSVELCAMYWHFLLLAWLVLFAVLASETVGMAICSTAVPL